MKLLKRKWLIRHLKLLQAFSNYHKIHKVLLFCHQIESKEFCCHENWKKIFKLLNWVKQQTFKNKRSMRLLGSINLSSLFQWGVTFHYFMSVGLPSSVNTVITFRMKSLVCLCLCSQPFYVLCFMSFMFMFSTFLYFMFFYVYFFESQVSKSKIVIVALVYLFPIHLCLYFFFCLKFLFFCFNPFPIYQLCFCCICVATTY